MSEDETYLGDAVYASFDGWNIWLRAGDGGNQRIALEPEVLAALFAFNKWAREQAAAAIESHEG